jgi:tetratricopeptide (TPR) repeat protein
MILTSIRSNRTKTFRPFLRTGYLLIVIAVYVTLVSAAAADWKDVREEEFFTYRRFFLKQGLIDSMAADGRAQEDLRRFYNSFTDGLYAISSDNLDEAEKDLQEARSTWPEYFGTDFLLGIVYEKRGDYQMASRYYRSYLNKLKGLEEGRYRISEPLIRSLNPVGIESYGFAKEMVTERMAPHGINIETVRPVITPPEFLFPFLTILALIAVYLFIQYWVWPRMKKQYRINHPPEGFWVCRHCGSDNPDTAKVCGDCDRPRGTK